ncbi:MAG TPA: 3'-5' exonuclease, partial [Polyangiaceae bacterium]|nr:3'-5' exonuclease [Polyangiaceae bacterium]
ERAQDPELLIAHWQSSRWAEVFFAHAAGETYELATSSGRVTGRVLERQLVGFREAELAVVLAAGRTLARRADGVWECWAPAEPLLEPRSSEAQQRTPSLIDVSLDPTQLGVVELPAQTSVLVLGEAGHGKTTVALHRLARLFRAARGEFRACVLVPTDGLRRLIEPLLRSLGVDVEVELYEHWARRQAQQVFLDLPERESQDATAGVIRLKRDPALRVALRELAEPRQPRPAPKRPTRPKKALARRRDLLHLFGDRRVLGNVLRGSAQVFGGHVLGELLEHTHVQFSRTSEQEYAHVDARRLVAIDGRPLDEGTPLQDAGSIDAEDYAVLFELDRLRAEARGRLPSEPPQYDCLLLDEAQEFAPLELALIGRSLAPNGCLIVAGDADQQTDATVSFTSWEQNMRELGCGAYERVVLPVSYRCPPDVARIARSLLGSATRAERPEPALLPFVHFLNECHLSSWLIDELERLAASDPSASVAVICRGPQTARRLHQALHHKNLGRLVLDGEFLFRSGINVTHLDQVKGLEFDHVIVPDASPNIYPDTPEARRALYVAVTRARHQLLLGAVAGQTPLLSRSAPAPEIGASLQGR